MKYITIAGILAAIAIFNGCANLPDFINPPRDPIIASTDAALVGVQLWVNRFLAYEEANPELMGLDARAAAEGLRKRFAGTITNLKNAKTAYLDNRTDENASNLKRILESALTDQNIAQGYLSGTILPQRGQIGPPQGPTTALDVILEQLVGIGAEQVSQRTELQMIRKTLGQVGHAVHSITNQTTEGNGTVTNKGPRLPTER